MNGERKALVYTVGIMVFCSIVVVVVVFWSLWAERAIVAWVVLAVVCALTLLLIVRQVNEMSIRHKRYHYFYETPLDQDGYPTHIPEGSQRYQRRVA